MGGVSHDRRDQDVAGPTGSRRTTLLLTLTVGLIVTLAASTVARHWDADRLRAEFEREAMPRVEALRRTLETEFGVLHALRAFYGASEAVSRDEFISFVRPLARRSSGARATGWVPCVRAADVASFERRAAAFAPEGFRVWERGPDGTRRPVQGRAEHFPVTLIEPLAGNEAAVGFDLGSEPTRREAIARATTTGELAVTGRLTLVQETGTQHSVLAVLPWFAPPETPEERAAGCGALRGLFTSVVRIGDLVEASVAAFEPGDVDLRLEDALAPPEARVLAERESRPRIAESDALDFDAPGPFATTASFEVGGRRWVVTAVPSPAFIRTRASALPLLVLATGSLLTALASAFILVRTRHSAALRRLTHRYETESAVRSRAEQALRRAESRESQIFASAPIAVYVIDPAALVSDAPELHAPQFSDQIEDLTGFSAAAFIEDPALWTSRIHPDDRPGVLTAWKSILKYDRCVTEYRWRHANGDDFWFLDQAVVSRDDHGAPIEVIGTRIDISNMKRTEFALRDSEERHRMLIEHAPICIHTIDLDGRFTAINSAGLAMLGVTDESAVCGVEYVSAAAEVDRERIRGLFDAALAGRPSEFEFRGMTPRGERIFSSNFIPIRGDDGAVIRIMGTSFDVTERRATEQRQRLMMSELDHRVKNNLAAVIALTHQTRVRATSLDDFARTLEGRIRAMALAHEALAAAKWTGVDLAKLMSRVIAVDDPARFVASGPAVLLPANASGPIAMALHELATNAMKYGAWCNATGHVEVLWAQTADTLELTWEETGGPPIVSGLAPGLGLMLITGFIEHELGGAVRVDGRTEGLACTISIPLTPKTHAPDDDASRPVPDLSVTNATTTPMTVEPEEVVP